MTDMPQKDWSDFAAGAVQPSREEELEAALQNLVSVIKAAGLFQLSKGVELGSTVWYVKASDAIAWAEQVLPPPPGQDT